MKKYSTMLTKGYVPDWNVEDGVREFVANCLDSDAQFVYDVGLDYVELTSVGVKLDISCFLLGVSENRNKKDAIGKHGEGSLTGLIPILRGNAKVEIFNGELLWQPAFEMDHNFNKEVLVINETQGLVGNKDYKVLISELDQDTIDTVVHNCLYLQDKESLGNYATAKCGSRIFFDVEGKLYVGGLFVCETDLSYSYDLHPSKIKLNRDRKQVSGWDLQGVTASLLKEVAEPKRIVEAAQKDVADVHHMRYSWSVGNIPSEVAEEAYSVFKLAYGDDAVVAESYSEMVRLQEQGFSKPVVVNDSFARLIRSSSDYETTFSEQEDALEVEEEKTPLELLEDWWLDACERYGNADFEPLLDIFRERELEYKYAAKKETVKGEFDDIPF